MNCPSLFIILPCSTKKYFVSVGIQVVFISYVHGITLPILFPLGMFDHGPFSTTYCKQYERLLQTVTRDAASGMYRLLFVDEKFDFQNLDTLVKYIMNSLWADGYIYLFANFCQLTSYPHVHRCKVYIITCDFSEYSFLKYILKTEYSFLKYILKTEYRFHKYILRLCIVFLNISQRLSIVFLNIS